MWNWFAKGFLLLWSAACLAGMTWGGWLLWQAGRSAAWPSVPGKITRSVLVWNDEKPRADLEYEYAIDGATHHGARRLFAQDAGGLQSQSDVQAILKRYPVGAAVPVFVDPADPTLAVLEPGMTKASWGALAMSTWMFLVGLGFAWLFWLSDPAAGPCARQTKCPEAGTSLPAPCL